MWEDEMTEENLAVTAEEYNRVTRNEIHDEKMAVAQAYIRALEAQVFGLKYQATLQSRALVCF